MNFCYSNAYCGFSSFSSRQSSAGHSLSCLFRRQTTTCRRRCGGRRRPVVVLAACSIDSRIRRFRVTGLRPIGSRPRPGGPGGPRGPGVLSGPGAHRCSRRTAALVTCDASGRLSAVRALAGRPVGSVRGGGIICGTGTGGIRGDGFPAVVARRRSASRVARVARASVPRASRAGSGRGDAPGHCAPFACPAETARRGCAVLAVRLDADESDRAA